MNGLSCFLYLLFLQMKCSVTLIQMLFHHLWPMFGTTTLAGVMVFTLVTTWSSLSDVKPLSISIREGFPVTKLINGYQPKRQEVGEDNYHFACLALAKTALLSTFDRATIIRRQLLIIDNTTSRWWTTLDVRVKSVDITPIFTQISGPLENTKDRSISRGRGGLVSLGWSHCLVKHMWLSITSFARAFHKIALLEP